MRKTAITLGFGTEVFGPVLIAAETNIREEPLK
jgi:hypothetical protein